MPNRRFPWESGYLLPSSSQLGSANLLRFTRLPPILSVEEMLYIIMSGSQSGQSATSMHNTLTPVEIAAQDETSNIESHAVNGQQVNTNNQETLLNDNPWAEESANLVVRAPAAPNGERGPGRAAVFRAKLVKALVGGVVSLIVLPGITLGVLMKQTMAGIALSSAITALANLFAGLYYYLNKRD